MVKAIREWPTPTSASEVRSFYGLISFYRRFIKDFSSIIAPFNELVKENVKFVWVEKQETTFAFFFLKLFYALILPLLAFTKTFELKCDTLSIDIGAVLMQEGCSITYFSEKLMRALLNYSEERCTLV